MQYAQLHSAQLYTNEQVNMSDWFRFNSHPHRIRCCVLG